MPFGLVAAWNKRRRSKSDDHIDPWIYRPVEYWKLEHDHNIQNRPPPKRRHGSSIFTLKEMEDATCSFSEDNLLGKGGFGKVYKGKLQSGEVVAIKKMELPPFKAAEGEREFRVEVDILSRLDHPNLVSLIGYCADGKQRFLVYEYMQKGNLQDHLNGIGEKKLDWPVRLKVAIGVARGLAYLHSSSAVGIPVVHRDFKTTNILLTDNYEAKISDFGLAKLMPEGQENHVTARVLGTFGYFDPKYTSSRGSQPETSTVTFTAPTSIRTKGCGTEKGTRSNKRIVGQAEKVIEKSKKVNGLRRCGECKQLVSGHNSRTCKHVQAQLQASAAAATAARAAAATQVPTTTISADSSSSVHASSSTVHPKIFEMSDGSSSSVHDASVGVDPIVFYWSWVSGALQHAFNSQPGASYTDSTHQHKE